MDKPCGLIGMPLGHSFSPQIHAMLGDYEYKLFPLHEAELAPFLESRAFHGLNVTIPYKKTVVPCCDTLSEAARHVGCVNTILCREDGTLYGHNTDYDGFMWLVGKSGIDVRGKKAVVLGTGGASLTVLAVLRDLGAGEIVNVSRTGEDNYVNLYLHHDADILVNATPVGMSPDISESPVSIDGFGDLEAVFDVIYNPARTRLMLDASARGIPAFGGLGMLVSQARAASELFQDKRIDDDVTEKIIRRISTETKNIILVGMPGAGKSTVGRLLAGMTGRAFYDSDELIVKCEGRTVESIFAESGEAGFRTLEHEAIAKLAGLSGAVISLGGGAVLREDNRTLMRQSSAVVWLRRGIGELPRDGRPLSRGADLERMYVLREPLYREVCDIVTDNDSTPEHAAEKIKEALGL